MKANELMPGDFVLTPIGKHAKVFDISSLNGEITVFFTPANGDVFDLTEIKPIPLTDSILIAKRWELIRDSTDYKYYRHSKMKSSVKYVKKYGIYVLKTICFRYVHEFQHILCLCGKEDLACNLL
jgi:hypothetical protein